MFLVCGEALFDVFVPDRADPGGSLPMRGVPGGSPFNVAIGLSRLGTPVAFLAGLSKDALGERLLERLVAEGVATDYILRRSERTTLSFVSLRPDGTPVYSFYGNGSADTALGVADVPKPGPNIQGLHLGSYAIVVPPIADALAALAAQLRGTLVTLDPNVRLGVAPEPSAWRRRIDALLPHVSVVKASDEDLSLLWPGRDIDAIAGDWLASGPRLVAVTRGGDGAVAYHAGRRLLVAPPAVTLADTVGAGDAFQSALIDGLLRIGARSPEAVSELSAEAVRRLMERSVLAGAIACSRRGADPPRRGDLAGMPV